MNKDDFYITTKVTTTNMELTPQLEDYVAEKLQALEKYRNHFALND